MRSVVESFCIHVLSPRVFYLSWLLGRPASPRMRWFGRQAGDKTQCLVIPLGHAGASDSAGTLP